MAKRYSNVVGIDIGSSTIKVAEVRIQGGRPAITALGIYPTPPGTVDQSGILDPETVGAAVREACQAAGVGVGEAVLSMAGQQSVLVRTLEVAVMNESELKQQMEWEVTRNIPFAESDVERDYKAFPPEDAAAQNMDVVMAISPRSAVDNALAVTKRATKKPVALDVEPLAISRVLATSYDADLGVQPVCVVEIGHKTTAINIYQKGKLLMPRQVALGGEMFTREIADRLGVPMDVAEDLKVRKARAPKPGAAPVGGSPFDPMGGTAAFAPYNPFADPEPAANPFAEPEATVDVPAVPAVAPDAGAGVDPETAAIDAAIAGVLDEVVSEIRRSIDYFRNKGGDVSQILICGGGSQMPGFADFLQSALGLTVQELDPTRNLSVSARGMDQLAIEKHRRELTVAIGNGLHIYF